MLKMLFKCCEFGEYRDAGFTAGQTFYDINLVAKQQKKSKYDEKTEFYWAAMEIYRNFLGILADCAFNRALRISVFIWVNFKWSFYSFYLIWNEQNTLFSLNCRMQSIIQQAVSRVYPQICRIIKKLFKNSRNEIHETHSLSNENGNFVDLCTNDKLNKINCKLSLCLTRRSN